MVFLFTRPNMVGLVGLVGMVHASDCGFPKMRTQLGVSYSAVRETSDFWTDRFR